jgi:hypothetical protein
MLLFTCTLGVAQISEAVDIPFPALPSGNSAQSNATVWLNTWQSGDVADVTIGDTDADLCFLSGIQGRQRGGSMVAVVESRGSWRLMTGPVPAANIFGPTGDPAPVAAGAICVPKADFILDPGAVASASDTVEISQNSGPEDGGWSCSHPPRQMSVALATGNAASALTSVAADLGSFADSISIVHPGSALEPAQLVATTTQDCVANQALARSFFFGDPGRDMWPKRPGYQVKTLRAESGRAASVPMTPTREGVCYWTSLAGNWDGHLEAAWIEPQNIDGTEYWTARINAGSGGEVEATVECISYDQRADDDNPDDFPS